MKIINCLPFFVLLMLIFFKLSCTNTNINGDSLSKKDIAFIRDLKLLEEREKIILFNTQGGLKRSGNFLTDKRIASYWIDKENEEKSNINFAFYEEVTAIDIKDRINELTYSSYLNVHKNDGTQFKVYVDADSLQTYEFFDQTISIWKEKNKKR